MTEIVDYLFTGCNLTSLTIGNSVTEIGNAAFPPSLTELYSLNPTPPTIGENNFTNAQYINIYVPKGSLSAYQAADEWKNFWNMQEFVGPTGVETIKAKDKKGDDAVYDILGRKLNAPKKGLNIINGKKVMIKK